MNAARLREKEESDAGSGHYFLTLVVKNSLSRSATSMRIAALVTATLPVMQ
jgi:hypothetical protein